MNKFLMTAVLALAIGAFLPGCKKSEPGDSSGADSATRTSSPSDSDTHVHADGSTHEDHEGEDDGHDHAHGEVSLGNVMIQDMSVELAQGHGKVEAGKESHLVVKLPYNDKGETVVRAWIGTDDRTMSQVGKGEYAPSHDDYDIHAVAPKPLPENVMWWIEIEKPDGTKAVGSAKPLM